MIREQNRRKKRDRGKAPQPCSKRFVNIKEAKEEIQNAMTAYFTKDDDGEYLVPVEKQRPVFVMGPPGIGKTAIMEQIAADMNVGLLSYSMTHHTRQSALGLPLIKHKVYDGAEYDISEYTMSEIIASIYDMMETTGVKEGILFLDEVNCVSETLTPVMLQFLQYKVFGRHRVPDGWIVVTAGNPPEYNDSVREFDIVTWDRLKRVDVEPEYDAWKEYAIAHGVHPSVTSYLELRKDDFYKVRTTVDGKTFATARGWEDLSQMIKLYELHDIPVTERVIGQYIQDPKISREFAAYYDLYTKYRSDYQIPEILAGSASEAVLQRVKSARFDERLAVLGMLLDAATASARTMMEMDMQLAELASILRDFRMQCASGRTPQEAMQRLMEDLGGQISAAKMSQSESHDAIARKKANLRLLEDYTQYTESADDGEEAFKGIRKDFDKRVRALKKQGKVIGTELENMFRFLEDAFGEGQEMLIAVTHLTVSPHTSDYIAKYGCDAYFRHNKDLLFYERQKEIEGVLDDLKLS